MSADLTNPIFTDETEARKHLEYLRWPKGPICPHCESEKITKLEGESHRPGVHQCNSCRQQFTVTVGTLFESSHIQLHKWLLAFHLMAASKKGISAHQLHRMLGITYKSAWFMAHRIREAMKADYTKVLGGNGPVEADETFIGTKPGRKKGRAGYGHKNAVLSLVERNGEVRSFHVPSVSAKTLKPYLKYHIDPDAHLMTDDAGQYRIIGPEFSQHDVVIHSQGEYSRGKVHTNTVEGFFSILKRGLIGTYHHVGAQHLQRYVTEFDFRYNLRKVTDFQRATQALKGITGKRLTYRRLG